MTANKVAGAFWAGLKDHQTESSGGGDLLDLTDVAAAGSATSSEAALESESDEAANADALIADSDRDSHHVVQGEALLNEVSNAEKVRPYLGAVASWRMLVADPAVACQARAEKERGNNALQQDKFHLGTRAASCAHCGDELPNSLRG